MIFVLIWGIMAATYLIDRAICAWENTRNSKNNKPGE